MPSILPSRTIEHIAILSTFVALLACGTADEQSPESMDSAPDASQAPFTDASMGRIIDEPVEASAELVKSNCSPVAATADGSRMVFNVRGTNGFFDAFLGSTTCEGEPLLPPYDGHRGAADITPDGRYVLLVTARGWDKATAGAEPGKGSSNSIDMFDRETGIVSTLVESSCAGCQRGAIWPRLSPDGSRVAWSEMAQSPLEISPIGRWRLHVSNLNSDRTTVVSDRVWEPRSDGSVLVEAYGWLPGSSDIIFATNDGVTDCTLTTCLQVFRIAENLPDVAATLLTPPVNGSNAYHEFAHFRNDGWIYTSIGRDGLGADLWRMKPDGSDEERITYFGGVWSNSQFAFVQVNGFPLPKYSIVGGMATVPGGFIAGVIHDDAASAIEAWRIEIVPK